MFWNLESIPHIFVIAQKALRQTTIKGIVLGHYGVARGENRLLLM
jgi:hypothetical protein